MAAVLSCVGLLWAAQADGAQAPSGVSCRIGDLPGLSTQFARAVRETRDARDDRTARGDARRAGVADDFWRVAEAILGPGDRDRLPPIDALPFAAVGEASQAELPCDHPVRARDRVAWSMGLGGYSAREIADVVGGHLTLADLRNAQVRLMAGQSRAEVSRVLEARWHDAVPASVAAPMVAGTRPAAPSAPARVAPVRVARPPQAPPPMPRSVGVDAHLDSELSALARRHNVAPELVRAVIAAESRGNPRAVSPAGAIGLMQLMPATAAALGVDPWHPVENLRGGITYLAGLLRAFDEDPRLALIAYNAGPQHAHRVRAGTAVAYRETRRYLETIAARYPLP